MSNSLALFAKATRCGRFAMLAGSIAWASTACQMPRADTPARATPVEGLHLDRTASGQAGVTRVRAVAKAGPVFDLYFDEASERHALTSAPRLASMYADIAVAAAAPVANIRWHPVLFARDPEGRLAAALGSKEIVWTVPMQADGRPATSPIGPLDGHFALDILIPHEQVHALQHSMYGSHRELPRWFVEGQAEWLGMRISERYAPAAARRARANRADNLAQADGSIDLRRWRMRADPAANVGRGTQAPILSVSESEQEAEAQGLAEAASYAAADALFQRVSREAGDDAMRRWFAAVAATRGDLDSAAMAALVKRETGVDIDADLANRSKTRL